jgi:hypothetical protein
MSMFTKHYIRKNNQLKLNQNVNVKIIDFSKKISKK